jgi:hypothetical protein
MIASQPTIDSAILRLAKERNEARDLCKRLFYCLPAQGGEKDEDAINTAYYEYLETSRRWKGAGHE